MSVKQAKIDLDSLLKRLDKLHDTTGYSWYSTTAGLNSISLPGKQAVEISVNDALEWFSHEYSIFESAGDWKERIMQAGTIEQLSAELRDIFKMDGDDSITIKNVGNGDGDIFNGNETTVLATSYKIAEYQKLAERLRKKANKLGISDFITIEKTGNERNATWVENVVDINREGNEIIQRHLVPEGETYSGKAIGSTKQYEVTIKGKPLKIEGWFVAGKAEHVMDDQGKFKAFVTGYNIRKEDVKSAGPLCEHCGKSRRRNATFILKNEKGEVKQVGSSCVDDFTGHKDAEAIADLMGASWQIFTAGDDGDDWDKERQSGGYNANNLEYFLAIVARVMEDDGGYIPVGEYGLRPTVNSAIMAYREAIKVKPEDFEKAKAAIAWAKNIENPNSSYMDNIKTLANLTFFPDSMLGIAGSMIHAYNKSIGKKIEERTYVNEHFGKVGEKIKDVKARIVSVKPIDGYYGTTYLYVFKADSGHTFKWFSSRGVGGDVGDYVAIAGTIKAHDEYQGKKQTNLTRAVLWNLDEQGRKLDDHGNVMESASDWREKINQAETIDELETVVNSVFDSKKDVVPENLRQLKVINDEDYGMSSTVYMVIDSGKYRVIMRDTDSGNTVDIREYNTESRAFAYQERSLLENRTPLMRQDSKKDIDEFTNRDNIKSPDKQNQGDRMKLTKTEQKVLDSIHDDAGVMRGLASGSRETEAAMKLQEKGLVRFEFNVDSSYERSGRTSRSRKVMVEQTGWVYPVKKQDTSDSSAENGIKTSLEEYKPQIEDRFKSIVTSQFERMVNALGPTLKGAFNHSSYAHLMAHGSSVRMSLNYDSSTKEYSLDTDKLNKLATIYAEQTIEKWELKIQSKMGDLENAKIHHLDGFRFSIEGTRQGGIIKVGIIQDMIVNMSSKGTLFNQFPARIYVNKKMVSESKYKEMFGA